MTAAPVLTGAAHHRGSSKQDYATPREFIDAVEARCGRMRFDLAASAENAKAPEWYDEQQDSLARRWSALRGNLWLNPPFGDIAPWAAKCAATLPRPCASDRIYLLVPASVGSNWFARQVDTKALVLFLSPRLSFDGKNPFPKDCCLAIYGEVPGYACWRWKP